MTLADIITAVGDLFTTVPEVPLLVAAGGVFGLGAYFVRRMVRAGR